MSYLKLVSVVAVSLLAGNFVARAEDKPAPAPKSETKPDDGKTRIIILDGKRVRVDDKMNVIEQLDEAAGAKTETVKVEPAKYEPVKEEVKDEKKGRNHKEATKEDLKEAKAQKNEFTAAPADSAPPAANPFAAEEAREKAAREVREAAQGLVENDIKMKAAVKKLASPGWRDAQVLLISNGKAAIPYLIDAMGDAGEGTPPAAYNLGGHTKSDAGRASRQRTLADVSCEVITELVKNHSDFKGEIPTCDQRAWQTWWTANGASVNFGK